MPIAFRHRAMAAQSGVESLHEPVRVVPVRSWLALGLAIVVLVGGGIWLFAGRVVIMTAGPGVIVNAPMNVTVTAPVDGMVLESSPATGTRVRAGDPIAVLGARADQSEVVLRSPVDGTVVGVGSGAGTSVLFGEEITIIAPDSTEQIGYAYVPAVDGGEVRPGLTAWMLPDNIDPTQDGYIRGSVATVSPLPATVSRIAYVLSNRALAEQVIAGGPVIEVMLLLEQDPGTPSGLAWTQSPGPAHPIVSGTPAAASIAVGELPPYRAFTTG